jgi:nitrogen fixation NifU-like protein
MDEMRELYQATILDHNKSPRNFSKPPNCNRHADGNNPLCGDKLTVFVALDGDRVEDVGFQGAGCAISTASASLMTEYVKGKTLEEVDETFDRFHELVTRPVGSASPAPELGKLAVFSGVSEYPVRVKCATLCWHTLRAALYEDGATVRTE